MLKETLVLTAIQSGILFLALWGIFRLAPAFPPNAKAWIWRLAFLKPLLSLMPFALVTLPILPSEQVVRVVNTDYGYTIETVETVPVPAPEPINIDPLLILWGAGVIGVAAYAMVGMRKAIRVTRSAQQVRDERLLKAFDDLLFRAGITNKPRLLTSQKVQTPMLVGGRSYAIVLPESALAQCEFEDLRLMMAHEVAHIERQDLWWFSLVSAVQSLFFFNPMVWVAVRCFRLDHESATDRHASRLAGVPIQTYADMLLRATTTARPAFAPGALPMAESYRTIHRRLEAMKHFNSKPTFWRRTSTAALAILTIGMLPAYNLVAAAVPMPEDDPIVSTGKAVAVRQTQEDKEVKKLKEQQAKLEKELRKKQAELEKLQREIDKKTGQTVTTKPTIGRTSSGWATQASGKAGAVQAKPGSTATYRVITTKPGQGTAANYRLITTKPAQGTAANYRLITTKPAQGTAASYRLITTKPTQGKAGVTWKVADPVKGTGVNVQGANGKWTTDKTGAIWRAVDPAKESKWETIKVTPQDRVSWRISDRSEQIGLEYKWRTQDVPSKGDDTVYFITGKNVRIERKGDTYYITADGPISIKPVKGGDEPKADVAHPTTGQTTVQGGTTVDTGKAVIRGSENIRPLHVQGGVTTYSGPTTVIQGQGVTTYSGPGTVVRGQQSSKPATVQGVTTYSGPATVVRGQQNSRPVTVQGVTTYSGQTTVTAPVKGYKGVTTTNGNYRIVTTGKNPYNVTIGHGKVKKETQKPKEKKRPSIDPLIFPPN